MVTVKECSNQIHAALLQSVLADNEIDSVLTDEHASAWCTAPFLVPIRLQVPEAQADKARLLIKEYEFRPGVI